jgi:hypothetical protein
MLRITVPVVLVLYLRIDIKTLGLSLDLLFFSLHFLKSGRQATKNTAYLIIIGIKKSTLDYNMLAFSYYKLKTLRELDYA